MLNHYAITQVQTDLNHKTVNTTKLNVDKMSTKVGVACAGNSVVQEAHNEVGLRVVREEIQNPPTLLQVVLGVGPQTPDQVRELDAIAHKEHLQCTHSSASTEPQRNDL